MVKEVINALKYVFYKIQNYDQYLRNCIDFRLT